ncbi:hypothetical protein, conserved [Trypanosoma brucei gambiense DAL972]|uniref:Uncharacterized protein n=1 Tax=Trypanosoma brucei gambiense (strain MHOM/CI/86/DAL972) TaxID=679716 RepID=C9ZKU4_TRYB9|nr:hypothetical protein, conserved [Trypanosoma brucei gambiense DAL972]CBH09687.1 hypothetical protein, conserved [Trypanosoma brucei gambiense DAL972]|eukprot:XP_011771980.1 hypothetical protein, conserved [Trypanosoma brucei gambiense DAL972]
MNSRTPYEKRKGDNKTKTKGKGEMMNHQRPEMMNPVGTMVSGVLNIALLFAAFTAVYIVVKSNHGVDLFSMAWNDFLRPNYDDDL